LGSQIFNRAEVKRMNDRIVLFQNMLLKERRKRGQAPDDPGARTVWRHLLGDPGYDHRAIGGALTDINQIRQQMLKTEQQVLWPLSLIHQAESDISTIKASYRGWMNNVSVLRP
jgi:hypothetical protein